MIKDLVVNLSVSRPTDAAAELAIEVAGELDAHLAAVAFAYEPVIAATVMGSAVSVDLIAAQRAENESAANHAVEKFERLAKLASVSFATHRLSSGAAGAADTFGRMARRFDLSIIGQAEPGVAAATAEEMMVEAALFQSGRPVMVVPYIHRGGLKL